MALLKRKICSLRPCNNPLAIYYTALLVGDNLESFWNLDIILVQKWLEEDCLTVIGCECWAWLRWEYPTELWVFGSIAIILLWADWYKRVDKRVTSGRPRVTVRREDRALFRLAGCHFYNNKHHFKEAWISHKPLLSRTRWNRQWSVRWRLLDLIKHSILTWHRVWRNVVGTRGMEKDPLIGWKYVPVACLGRIHVSMTCAQPRKYFLQSYLVVVVSWSGVAYLFPVRLT